MTPDLPYWYAVVHGERTQETTVVWSLGEIDENDPIFSENDTIIHSGRSDAVNLESLHDELSDDFDIDHLVALGELRGPYR